MYRADNVAIWLVREQAEPLAELLSIHLSATIYRPWLIDDPCQIDLFRTVFRRHDSWILIMATGIAVRFLDGLMESKLTDPAVVVLDEGANFAVSLLGGHEAGANRLSSYVAELTGAIPVVTTATESKRSLSVGLGTRKNIVPERVEEAVKYALDGRSFDEIRDVATIDLKASEPAIRDFVEKLNVPLRVFSLAAVASRLWNTAPSDWVLKNIGVYGVCEPCALMANPRGLLKVKKTTCNGVAVAIVEDQR